MYTRLIQKNIEEALGDTSVIIVNGARQTGKSTLCKTLIDTKMLDADYITFDSRTPMAAAQKDPEGFLAGLKPHVVLDEIQRVPEILLAIKKYIDTDRTNRRFILTGSADVMTLPKLSESLAGRIEIHNLWSLSQDEIRGKKSSFLDKLIDPSNPFHTGATSWEDIINILTIGGYPEILSRKNEQRRIKWFEAYINSILQKDIKELANIEKISEIPNLLEILAGRVGSTVNLADISRLLGMPASTVKRYYMLLQHVFLIKEIPAWTPNFEGRFVKMPKIFISDTGVLCYLRGDTHTSLLHDRNRVGAVMENFVIMEIIKQMSWSPLGFKPYHFRDHKGIEVDLLLENRQKHIYGIEIKTSASVKSSDFKGLEYFAEHNPKNFKKGIVFYTGDQYIQFSEKMHAVPLSLLWE
jgi:uncharacterized protein